MAASVGESKSTSWRAARAGWAAERWVAAAPRLLGPRRLTWQPKIVFSEKRTGGARGTTLAPVAVAEIFATDPFPCTLFAIRLFQIAKNSRSKTLAPGPRPALADEGMVAAATPLRHSGKRLCRWQHRFVGAHFGVASGTTLSAANAPAGRLKKTLLEPKIRARPRHGRSGEKSKTCDHRTNLANNRRSCCSGGSTAASSKERVVPLAQPFLSRMIRLDHGHHPKKGRDHRYSAEGTEFSAKKPQRRRPALAKNRPQE